MGQQRAWGPVQENAGAPAQTLAEELRVTQRQVHRLQDGRLDVLQAPHVIPLHVWHLAAAPAILPQTPDASL